MRRKLLTIAAFLMLQVFVLPTPNFLPDGDPLPCPECCPDGPYCKDK